MSTALARAHILGQERLRAIIVQAITAAWTGLPGYDERDVDQFLAQALPLVTAAQRQSVALTEAFLARAVERLALGVPPDRVSTEARPADPAEVYRRPFVTVWTALKAGKTFDDAVSQGLARATSTAATDVQLAMRQTLREVGNADPRIVGFQRVADAGACSFCQIVAGQRYTTDQLMPIHNHCGCGVDVITARNRGDFTGRPDRDLSVTKDGVTAAVEVHGELGPVLVNADHHFSRL